MPERPDTHTVIPAEPGWAIVGFDNAVAPATYVCAIIAWDVRVSFDADDKAFWTETTPVTAAGAPDWEYRWYRQPDGMVVDRFDASTYPEHEAREIDAEIQARKARAAKVLA